jgi:hypothetical protein
MPVTLDSVNVKGTSVTTASYVAWANVFETNADTFLGTASYISWANVDETNQHTFLGTASYATTALSSSFATTASFALNAGGGGSTGGTNLGVIIAYQSRMI